MSTLEKVRRWVRDNGGYGWKGMEFVDDFHGLRKILGMPTSETGIYNEWNRRKRSAARVRV
jgi:hypothetical protein